MDNNNTSRSSSFNYVLLVILLMLAFFLSIFKVRQAQSKLNEHLRSKHSALEEILNNIEVARRERDSLERYKRISKFCLRLFFVITLIVLNFFYIRKFLGTNDKTLPNALGAMLDLNAILLLAVSLLVFVVYGSVFKLNETLDFTQNWVLQKFFKKREEQIDILLSSNLEDLESIKTEINDTEEAIRQNEELLKNLQVETEEGMAIQ